MGFEAPLELRHVHERRGGVLLGHLQNPLKTSVPKSFSHHGLSQRRAVALPREVCQNHDGQTRMKELDGQLTCRFV